MSIQERLSSLIADAPPDVDALVRGEVRWTWGELGECARGVLATLDDLGLGPDARVGMVLENQPSFVAAVTAVVASSRCVTTLSPLQPPERLCRDIDRSALPVVLASRRTLDQPGVTAAIAAHGRVVELADDGTATVLPDRPAGASTDRVTAPGVVIEMFTSGTTGEPKRVELTYRQLDTSLASAAFGYRAGPDGTVGLSTGVTIISTPMVHIGGLWFALGSVYSGHRTVLVDRFTVEEWVAAVATHRPVTAGLVPAAMRMLLDADVPPEKLASLDVVTSGTAPCPPELADAMLHRYGIRVLMTYGATEFSGAVVGWTKADHIAYWETKKGAAGRAFPGVHVRVVAGDGTEVAAGAPGTLEIRAPQAANGGREWIRTSDLARLDADGFVWIEGRADDAIIRGGFKVHPAAVKRVLESHPAVREAVVAGIPHARLGQVPVAAVELTPGPAAPAPADLVALCREQLLPYEVPVEIVVLDQLPRTPSMKVDRTALLAALAERRAAVPAGG